MSTLGDFSHDGLRLLVSRLVIKLDKKAITPWLTGGKRLDSPNVDSVACERSQGVEQCTRDITGREEQHCACRRGDRE